MRGTGLGAGSGRGRVRAASAGTGSGPPRAPAGCRPKCPLCARSHLTGRRCPCPTGQPGGGSERRGGELRGYWGAARPLESWHPASPQTPQHSLGPSQQQASWSQPSAHRDAFRLLRRHHRAFLRRAGNRQCLLSGQFELRTAGRAPGHSTACSSAQSHQGTQWSRPACPGPAQAPASEGLLPTWAMSLRVCCSPSPSSASRAACSWSRRDS